MTHSFTSTFLFIATHLIANTQGNVIVETSSGPVRGVEVTSIIPNEKYHSFMGIPFAEPPVGALRFMPPKPHKGWTDTLDATKEKKPCAQFNYPMRKIKNPGPCGVEDCLHLSIHTPKPEEKSSFPVIVFLYNENFKVSYNNSKDYGPDFFMKEDVIVVMVNHRLGALGFLSFEDDLLPGNNGIRDVILALKWIKENIHHFGGDPYRVTLMGNEDGATVVDILLHSPKAKGLFNNVILQDGTSWSSLYFTGKARQRAIKFSTELNEEATTSSYLLKRFSDLDALHIAESETLSVHADEARELQRGILAFGPVIEHEHEDAIITRLPEEGPLDINVPIMIGYSSRAALESLKRYMVQPQYLTFADRDFLLMFPVRSGYRFHNQHNIYYLAIDEIKQFYFDEAYVKVSKPGEYISYITDVMSFYPIDYTVRKYTNESKSDVFYYTFDYSGELNMRKKNVLAEAKTIDGTWGATMGDDLCYLFVCKPMKKVYKNVLQEEDSEDLNVLRNMVRMWTNFAKTSNPTPPGNDFMWKPASKENKECLVISEDLQMKTRLHDDVVSFWDQFLEKYRQMAVDGVVKDIKDEL